MTLDVCFFFEMFSQYFKIGILNKMFSITNMENMNSLICEISYFLLIFQFIVFLTICNEKIKGNSNHNKSNNQCKNEILFVYSAGMRILRLIENLVHIVMNIIILLLHFHISICINISRRIDIFVIYFCHFVIFVKSYLFLLWKLFHIFYLFSLREFSLLNLFNLYELLL